MKAMSQFNDMIKSMPYWLKLMLSVLTTLFVILMIWAACPSTGGGDTEIVINNYQATDSVMVARLGCARDSIEVLKSEMKKAQTKADSLQSELNKYKKAQQLRVDHQNPLVIKQKVK